MASQYRRRLLMLNTIAKVAQGNPTIITDSSSRRLQKLNIYGQSEQASTTGKNLLNPTGATKEGWNIALPNFKLEVSKQYTYMVELGSVATEFEPYTGGKPSPSPDYPQEIISKEVSEIKVTNGADLSQTITLIDPITLRGIPVSSGGNVTIDGQQYIADYIDSLTGKINRLNGYIDSYNGEEVGTIYMSTTGQLTTGAKVIYKLSQPTQEDLPQQDQEAIRALTTYYPNTVIQTGCWNEVTYSAKRGG